MSADRGWKIITGSNKAHFFIEGRSLCRKWLNLGRDGFEDHTHDSPDNCAPCRRAREKLETRKSLTNES